VVNIYNKNATKILGHKLMTLFIKKLKKRKKRKKKKRVGDKSGLFL
jgi:hypothetical protein